MKRNDASTVKSLNRGLDILEYIATAQNAPSFSQLLRDLDIPRSSLFHLLSNLQLRGFLAREPTNERYRLGPNLAKLAKAAPQPSLVITVSPFVRQLSAELNETCGFYVRVEDAVEVIASAISTQALSYTMKVGARAPLYAVSTGKIVLAQFEPHLLKQYLTQVDLSPVTARTIRSSGMVTIIAGTHSHGQGHATAFSQLVAEWLGVPFENINYIQGDTDKVADGRGTFAARSSMVGGNALRAAADAVIARGKEMARPTPSAGSTAMA